MLPVLDRIIYKADVLSRSTPIEFVPYTVKEGKILLMARESKELPSIVDGLRQILSNCIVDKTIDVTKLPLIDLEWLFLKIHSKSAGEKVNLYYKCTNEVAGNSCGMLMEFEVDLNTVAIHNKTVEKKIMITDTIGVMMKLPTFEGSQRLMNADPEDHDKILSAACIDYVFDETGIYKADDATEEEMLFFVDNLPIPKYEKIGKFFDDCPVIKHDIETICPKCEFHHKITLEGLEDFFV